MVHLSFSKRGLIIIPDKESFFKDIGNSTDYNDDFFKKIYGYSYCDKGFIEKVATKLLSIQRKDVIEEYNKWYIKWQTKYNTMMKDIASGYCKEQQRLYGDLFKDKPERKVHTICTKEELLLQKKKLLLQKKKLLMQKLMR